MVDGMISGTGVRDAVESGYLTLSALPISPSLLADIQKWLGHYHAAHHAGFVDKEAITALDAEGIDFADRLAAELPGTKVGYYSDAHTTVIKHLI